MPVGTGSDVSRRIMGAARELFFANGFLSTPLRVIANKGGTSESGVLRIYGSKSGLLRAVYASCWAEINDRVDQALAAAAEKSSDPRYLLLELTQTVWQVYQDNPRMMVFMMSHFGFRETIGLGRTDDNVPPEIDETLKREYHRYVNRITDLCDAITRNEPAFAESGLTPAGLGHVFTSIIHSLQTNRYMALQESAEPDLSLEEVLAVARFFLYPEMRRTKSHD